MPGMMRKYAREKLEAQGAALETEHAHAEYFLQLVERLAPVLKSVPNPDRLAVQRTPINAAQPGGIGKTHLSIELARRLSTEFAYEAYFVDLSPVRVADQVLSLIA